MKTSGILATVAALVAAPLALAHHSAVQYDFSKLQEIKGTVKQFTAANPHMRMTLEVKDAKGSHEVKLEGHSTNNMYRNGYRKGMVNVGDAVTVNVAPLRNGDEGGYVLGATAANGDYFGVRSTRALDAAKAKEQAEGK
jgi:soluble cytochrome b562